MKTFLVWGLVLGLVLISSSTILANDTVQSNTARVVQPVTSSPSTNKLTQVLFNAGQPAPLPWPSAASLPGGACNISQTLPILESVTQNLKPEVLRLGLMAYNCAVKAGMDKQKVLTLIDYTIPSNIKRLWVFDLEKNKVLFATWVAHGKGSGDILPDKFSNTPESHQSSIGLFLTGNIYQGKHGASLKLYGLERGFNDKAEERHIVVHGAPYVSEQAAAAGRIGRSWGCPAISPNKALLLIPMIQSGSLIFSYYTDQNWLKNSKYLHCTTQDTSITPNPPM